MCLFESKFCWFRRHKCHIICGQYFAISSIVPCRSEVYIAQFREISAQAAQAGSSGENFLNSLLVAAPVSELLTGLSLGAQAVSCWSDWLIGKASRGKILHLCSLPPNSKTLYSLVAKLLVNSWVSSKE